jgi:hypothetical protein
MPKLPKLPKMPKVNVSYRFYEIKKLTLSYHFIVLIFGLPYGRRPRLIKKTERSDTLILGTLGNLVHFRHFCY